MAIQLPPATGHSNTFVVPLDAVALVGQNDCLTVHVPGPANPPPAPHASKSNENGTLIPEPDASCVRYPASTVIVTSLVTVVLIGTVPKATVEGFAPAASALPGSADTTNSKPSTMHQREPTKRVIQSPFVGPTIREPVPRA